MRRRDLIRERVLARRRADRAAELADVAILEELAGDDQVGGSKLAPAIAAEPPHDQELDFG